MNFRIGCAIWAYKEWVGELFPVGSKPAEYLQLYSRRFTTVEGNTTFYSIPSAAMVRRWAEETPGGFKFCPKLPRDVTHRGGLAPLLTEAIAFLDRMAPLGDRLGPILAQLPPAYGPEHFNDLTTFLAGWPHQRSPLAVEVRHGDWFQTPWSDRLNALLEQWNVGRALLDTRPIYDCPDDPQLDSERRKPRVPLPVVTTAPFSLIRYISHPALEMNTSYWDEWIPHIDRWLQQGKQVYVFVHCPLEVRSPYNARQFQHRLEQAGIAVPPLPWNGLEARSPSQLSLF